MRTILRILLPPTLIAAAGVRRPAAPPAARLKPPHPRKHLLVAPLMIFAVMFSHRLQDLFGKSIGPLSIGVVRRPLLAMGVPETIFGPGNPCFRC